MHAGIYQLLQAVARAGETATYGEVGRVAHLDMGNPRHRSVLGLILDEIDRHEHRSGRPHLAAVVVLKRTGISSRGFFACARGLGVETGPNDRSFWEAELRRVHDHWSRR